MKNVDGMIISIIGLGFVVGSLVTVLRIELVILLSIGLGLIVGGAFREINNLKKRK